MMNKNFNIAGVDEAGRGAWAGPVVAATVILLNIDKIILDSLQDSKKIPEKKRIRIYHQLINSAKKSQLYYGIGIASVEEIFHFNILQASLLAMKRSIFNFQKKFRSQFYIWVDGNQIPKFNFLELSNLSNDFMRFSKSIISGDKFYPQISAASIIAKTFRDDLMVKYDKHFPQYRFAKHKGYGTAQHQKALDIYGICPIHRKSYKPIERIINSQKYC